MKKIDWFKRFANLAKKHKIWWGVCTDGSLDEITFTDTEITIEAPWTLIGTKAAYLWLEEQVKENSYANG